ncbi:uncharacterized protein LOC122503205 [Leptopilina heterotoma]|uniref:uncharacterized protein LOC122503205 n=1 Tax=Leptopilina heterotoma TaxID=63436 RepID=UPI001CAA09F0|nr:uncharacterized protein LOC122503205 [Leptopilina heterotoma]
MTKSGEKGLWVISGRVFYKPDIYKPFAIAIYSGNSKPASVDDFMNDFIVEINNLTHRGVTISEKRFNVRIHCFLCDTPARAFLKCTEGHTGFYSCERCEVRGLKLNNVTQFPLTNCPERTDESFRRCSQRRHHKGLSPILKIKPSLNMIFIFVLEFMHLFCEGMMKRLLMFWFIVGGRNNVGQQVKKEVSRRIRKLNGLLRSANRPLAQICRRLHELDKIDPPNPRK